MTPKPCAVVADSHLHANAIIGWGGLDRTIWVPVRYGETLRLHYHAAVIVRPLSGISLAHLAWLEVDLFPRVAGEKIAMPAEWVPDQGVDVLDALGFSSMWTT